MLLLYCGGACQRVRVSAGFRRCTRGALDRERGVSPDQRGELSGIAALRQVFQTNSDWRRDGPAEGHPQNAGRDFARESRGSLWRSAGASVPPVRQTLPGLLRALTECNHIFFSLFCFCSHCSRCSIHIVYDSLWCLKLLFIPLSEMYNFISYFELWDWIGVSEG